MRTNDRNRRTALLPAVGLSALMLGLACSCGGKKKAVPAEVAVVPDANLVLRIDAEGIQETPIYKKLEAMGKEEGAAMPTDKVREMQDLAKETLGIEKDAMKTILFSADLANLDFSAPEPPDPETVNLLAAVELKSAVSLKDIRAYLKTQAEKEGEEILLEEESYKDATILYAGEKPGDEAAASADMPRFRMALALQNKGKLVLVGTEKGVKGGLERADSKKLAKDSSAMGKRRGQVPKDAHFYLAFVPTQHMRTMVAEQSEAGQGNPAMVQSMQSLANMQSAAVSMTMNKNVGFALQMALAGEEQAKQLKTMMDSMMVSGLKMAAMQFSGGKGMPFTETITLLQKGEELTFKMSISEEDLDTAAKGVKKMFTPMSSGDMPPPPPPQTP